MTRLHRSDALRSEILASAVQQIGTPAYVYDLDGIAREARELREAFGDKPHLVAYAVKANTAGAILRTLAAEGCGADVVSGAELSVALGAGISADKVIYSGVAKRDDELDAAIACGERGILAVQIESVEEIARVAARARACASAGRRARVSLRVNPAVDRKAIDTHAHITTGHDEAKFGVPRHDVGAALERLRVASAHVELVGFGAHVGSQLTTTAAYVQAARTLFAIARDLDADVRAKLEYIDTGGGFGIAYDGRETPRPADFVRAVLAEQRAAGLDRHALLVEPGRSLVGAHGVLVASVVQTKTTVVDGKPRRWLMIDAGMNDLVRPAMYQAYHRIVPLDVDRPQQAASSSSSDVAWRVVGPVCESSDDFGVHPLPEIAPAHVVVLDAGAYGFTMASQYNGRALPAEAFVRGGQIVATSPRGDVAAWVRHRLAT